ncbi:MAG TPA: hypothetical protein VLX68_14725 [Chitinivibrionales bacterium]|nr:hypothetical protein [Chitinivibrionales bacterium]
MKRTFAIVLLLGLCAGWTFAVQEAKQASAPSSLQSPVMIEGRIVSVDIAGKSLVLKANIEREDTFKVDSAVIIKAGKINATMKDLAPKIPVHVHYSIKEGKKIAMRIATQPMWREAPPAVIKGYDVIMAEGVIRSIRDQGRTMIISAALEQQDTFSLDSNAVIKAGNRLSTLDEIKEYAKAQIHYTIEGGRRIAHKIIGTIKKIGGGN